MEITLQERRSLEHLKLCMNKFSFNTKEYNLARRAFAFLLNQKRVKVKTDKENCEHTN